MEKFSRVLRGYDPEEVNNFLDKVIEQVEDIINQTKIKDEELHRLKQLEKEYYIMKDKVDSFERMEETLKRAILMAERTSEQIKLTAHQESDIIISDAKKNASRIVNDALLKSEIIEQNAETLKRNVVVFKKRLREVIETQLQLVDDIEKIDI